MGGCDLEEGDIVCPKCGNDRFDKLYIEPLGFQCLKCGYDSRDIRKNLKGNQQVLGDKKDGNIGRI